MAKLTKIQVDLLRKFIDKFELNIVSNGENIMFEDAVRILEGELPQKQTVEEKKKYFISILKPYVGKYGSDMLNKFYRYWVAVDGHKLRFEKQSVFDVELRLATWKRNDEEYERRKYMEKLNSRL